MGMSKKFLIFNNFQFFIRILIKLYMIFIYLTFDRLLVQQQLNLYPNNLKFLIKSHPAMNPYFSLLDARKSRRKLRRFFFLFLKGG